MFDETDSHSDDDAMSFIHQKQQQQQQQSKHQEKSVLQFEFAYDYYFKLQLSASNSKQSQQSITQQCQQIHNLLTRALTDRITQLTVKPHIDANQSQQQQQCIAIGLCIHPLNAKRIIDRCVASSDNHAESAAFQQLYCPTNC
jgi:hypothetical protein